MDHARTALRRHFGHHDFRAGQVDVVDAVLAGADTLGVLPTGGGKSLCYQVPALVFPGLTVVISPLISLMKDQVDRLVSHGIEATFLNSTLDADEVSRRLLRAVRGELKLLYVAPERFEASDLRRTLDRCTVSLLAVDEAHCISEWGHDFRPSFRRIAAVCEALGRPQTVALTATATPAVRGDILRQLRLRTPRVIVSGFDRANLRYDVRRCGTDSEKDQLLLATVRSHPRPSIVYAATRSTVERVARLMTRSGVGALPYHGGLEDEHRHETQETFMQGRVDAIVATNAFGMGIDKPDVRLVVHYAMPGTLESYYQEAGRAGRDGRSAACVLLHAHGDRCTHEWFIHGMYPEREAVERVYRALQADQLDGEVQRLPSGRESDAAIRLLVRDGVLLHPPTPHGRIWVRLLGTPARIRRELGSAQDAPAIRLLQDLWRIAGSRLQAGVFLNAAALPIGKAGRRGRSVLEELRDRQFVDFRAVGSGLFLARPGAPLSEFAVNWDGLARRRESDLRKLDMMEQYAHEKKCRRAFVLRYFGEDGISDHCGGCDNCLPG